MVWEVIAKAGVDFITGMVGGQQQRSAADAANKEQDKIAKARLVRDTKEWELNYLEGLSDYAWSLANTEAARYQDRVKEEDYNAQQSRIIDAAISNLELNSGALMDQYITGEQLRLTQETYALEDGLDNEQLKLDSTMAGLEASGMQALLKKDEEIAAYNQAIQQAKLTNNQEQVSYNMTALEATLQNRQNIASYLNSIKQRAIQSNQISSRKTAEGQGIQEQIIIDEQLDTLRRDADYITALAEGADTRAGATARQGGSNSSRAIALDSMKAFGRSYALLKTEQKKRRRALSNYNAQLSGETAEQMAQIAAGIENDANSIKYSRASNALQLLDLKQKSLFSEGRKALTINDLKQKKGFSRAEKRLTFDDLNTRAQLAQVQYGINNDSLMRNFTDLTLPGFSLASKQGQREYQALVNNTVNTVKAASTPYRKAIIFDPLEPIAGLKPEKMLTTKVEKPSWGTILTQSALEAAKGAANSAYTDENGNLAFR